MAAEASMHNDPNTVFEEEEEKVNLGTFEIRFSEADLSKIKEKIGVIAEVQLILRGDISLGYGNVILKGPTASHGERTDENTITADGRIRAPRKKNANKTRGARKAAGRARRSADEPEGEENNGGIVASITDGISKLATGAVNAVTGSGAEQSTDRPARGAGKSKRGKGNARQPRARKERGEPSKTLVFIRNLPFSMNEEGLASLFKEHSLSYSSLSIPLWKYGPRKGKGRGYAFATVSTEEEQTKAIETLNGKEIHTGEMYTPRTPVAAQAEAAQLTEGAIAAPDDTPAAPAEPIERVLKVVARQGYENEDQNREQEHEEEGNAAAAADAAANAGVNGNAGPEDSGTAEQTTA